VGEIGEFAILRRWGDAGVATVVLQSPDAEAERHGAEEGGASACLRRWGDVGVTSAVLHSPIAAESDRLRCGLVGGAISAAKRTPPRQQVTLCTTWCLQWRSLGSRIGGPMLALFRRPVLPVPVASAHGGEDGAAMCLLVAAVDDCAWAGVFAPSQTLVLVTLPFARARLSERSCSPFALAPSANTGTATLVGVPPGLDLLRESGAEGALLRSGVLSLRLPQDG